MTEMNSSECSLTTELFKHLEELSEEFDSVVFKNLGKLAEEFDKTRAERDDLIRAILRDWPECLMEEGTQEMLERLGLVSPVTVDRGMIEECGNECCECEPGMECYGLTQKAINAVQASKADRHNE